MVDMAFFRGGLGRWLPPSVPPVDEAVLLRRCWELLVLDRPGTARLAALGRAPLCCTVLLPQENTAAPLRAQQVVGCGLSPRCSLTLSGLTPRPVLCVQRRLTAVNGAAIEPQDIPLPLRWGRCTGAAAGRRRLAAGGGPSAGLKSKRSAHMGAPLAFSPVSPVGVSIRYPAFR